MIEDFKDGMGVWGTFPENRLGDERCFSVEFDSSMDTHFTFWRGTLDQSHAAQATGFQIMHSHEIYVVAAAIGYQRLIGTAETAVRDMYLDAAGIVLEHPLQLSHDSNSGWLDEIARGQTSATYDREDLGLKCLVGPIAPHPGGRLSATGIYIGSNEGEDPVLVFAAEEDTTQTQAKLPFRTLGMIELCEVETPVLTGALCRLSSGDNKKSLAALFARQFDIA